MARTLSPLGRKLIQELEGLSLTAYPDGDGYSIGYGHHGVQKGEVITRAEAERLFEQDVKRFESSVNIYAGQGTTQEQFDALVSFAYNVGTGAFQTSTLLRKHLGGDIAGAADEFNRWVNSQGKKLQVLVDRRARERAIYLNGYAGAPPAPPFVMPPAVPPGTTLPKAPRAELASPPSPLAPSGSGSSHAASAALDADNAPLPPLKVGSRGTAVLLAQRLINADLDDVRALELDGWFGTKTATTLALLQTENDVHPIKPGEVDARTWRWLVTR